jgi:DNA replication protein DnaC
MECMECGRELFNGIIACDFCERRQRTINSLPKRIKYDLKTITFPDEQIEKGIDVLKQTGRCLYITGPVGSGKTRFAAALLMSSYNKVRGHGERIFVSVPELLLEIKSVFNGKEKTEADVIRKYNDASILVMDDFGVEKTTDWSFQVLDVIINHRYEHMKNTIFTSNITIDQLAEKFDDDRISSRINEMSDIYIFDRKDLRKQK